MDLSASFAVNSRFGIGTVFSDFFVAVAPIYLLTAFNPAFPKASALPKDEDDDDDDDADAADEPPARPDKAADELPADEFGTFLGLGLFSLPVPPSIIPTRFAKVPSKRPPPPLPLPFFPPGGGVSPPGIFFPPAEIPGGVLPPPDPFLTPIPAPSLPPTTPPPIEDRPIPPILLAAA